MRSLALALLVLCLALPVHAADWTRRENRALIQGSRAGWALETPADWVGIPDVKPAWPLGAGYRDPKGTLGVLVTWVPQVGAGELESLARRGYQESPARVAGHEARIFGRSGADSVHRVAYLSLPEGSYRIVLFSAPGGGEVLDRILGSFQLVRGLAPSDPGRWASHEDPGAGYRVSYPCDWSLKDRAEGFELSNRDGVVVRATARRPEGEAGLSLRGFARSAGRTTLPGAVSLERFEPIDAGGITGYLAVWKLQGGELRGPVVYLPLAAPWKALELVLLQPREEEAFFRLVDSFRAVPAATPAPAATPTPAETPAPSPTPAPAPSPAPTGP